MKSVDKTLEDIRKAFEKGDLRCISGLFASLKGRQSVDLSGCKVDTIPKIKTLTSLPSSINNLKVKGDLFGQDYCIDDGVGYAVEIYLPAEPGAIDALVDVLRTRYHITTLSANNRVLPDRIEEQLEINRNRPSIMEALQNKLGPGMPEALAALTCSYWTSQEGKQTPGWKERVGSAQSRGSWCSIL